jgi:hypothetical protein
MGMATMGMQARLMSQALRKLTSILAKARTTCIFTNQLREKLAVMFGNPGNDARRQGVEILCEHSHRHSPQGDDQGPGRECDRQPGEGEDREEQGRAAVRRGGI